VQAFFALLGYHFVGYWISPEHGASCYATLLLLSSPLALVAAQSVASRVLYGVGRLWFFSRLVLAEAVANAILSCLLVVPYGIEGVAFGTLLPNVVCTILVTRHVLQILGIDCGTYLLHTFCKPFLATAVVSGFWALALAFGLANSLLGFLGVAIGGALGYGILALFGEFGFAVSDWALIRQLFRPHFPKPTLSIDSDCPMTLKGPLHEPRIDYSGYGIGGTDRPGGPARVDLPGL
jgi:O-antigen/teichoic acid export membrane protein